MAGAILLQLRCTKLSWSMICTQSAIEWAVMSRFATVKSISSYSIYALASHRCMELIEDQLQNSVFFPVFAAVLYTACGSTSPLTTTLLVGRSISTLSTPAIELSVWNHPSYLIVHLFRAERLSTRASGIGERRTGHLGQHSANCSFTASTHHSNFECHLLQRVEAVRRKQKT